MRVIITYWKQILICILLIICIKSISVIRNLYTEITQNHENLRQSELINSTYRLSSEEFRDLLKNSEKRTFRHIDSLLKANKMNPNGVNQAQNVTNIYRDTTILRLQIPAAGTLKPVNITDKCWGFTGVISNNELIISERYSNVEIDLFDYARPKKFLGIIWGWRKPEMKAFSNCGTVFVKSYMRVKN